MKKGKDKEKDMAEEVEQEVLPENGLLEALDQQDAELKDENIEREEELTPEMKIEKLQAELVEVSGKAEEYLDGWQRARAEFANYKKRILKENTEIRQVARGEVIKIYLDIVDDLKRALQDKPDQEESESWSAGIELIYQKLLTRLETEGVKPMNAKGEEFDPTIHEALMTEESDEHESGQIIEVMQEGYWIGEKVLRPALVRVAA